MKIENLTFMNFRLDDEKDYKTLQEIVRTQQYGEPVEPRKGSVAVRMDSRKFAVVVSSFHTQYADMARNLLERAGELSQEEARSAIKILKRAETLYGMANTFSEANEAFRRANVEKGKDYTGTHTSYWRRLEIAAGLEKTGSRPQDFRVVHQDHSFN